MGYDGLLFCFWVQSGTGMSYVSIFSFFSAIFAGPRFIEFQEFCYSKTKRRKQLFLSTSSKTTQMSTSAWGMPFLQYLPLPFSTKTTPTAHNSTQSLIIPLHQWCSFAHDHKYPQYRGTAVRMQCLVGTCCWPRSSLIYNMLFSIRTYSIQILILESHQNLKCHQWIWHELEWQQVFP